MTHPLSAPFLRRGPYSFLILAALCVAGLAALGAWQVTRLAQKEAVIADRQAMLAQPPLDLTHAKDAGAVNPYRRVMITGRFLHEQEIAVGPKPRLGRAGWQVITPLKRTDGRIVFVDRGWVPENRKDPRSRPEGQVTGTITVTGILKRVAPRGRFVPDNDAAKGNWYWVDPATLASHLDLSDVAPYWVVAGRDRDRQVGPIGIDRVEMPANNHLGYAITWYALAVAVGVVAFVYWRQSLPSDTDDYA